MLSLCFVSFTIESFLRNRSSQDHEATAMMKAQFMSLWDGLDTSATTQVKTITLHHLFTALIVREIIENNFLKNWVGENLGELLLVDMVLRKKEFWHLFSYLLSLIIN